MDERVLIREVEKKKANKEMKMKKMKQGFTLVEIMIVVAIIGLLAAIAIPSFMKSRTTSQKNACLNNLRQIDSAKEQWAMEKEKSTGDAVTDSEVEAYMKDGRPNCPSGGTYTFGVVGTAADCDKH
jgi:prepilin-type N-terminal cleavage/methylation domain-containing protein